MPVIDKIREALSTMEDTLLQKNQISALLRGKEEINIRVYN
jgi:hypothetical protein